MSKLIEYILHSCNPLYQFIVLIIQNVLGQLLKQFVYLTIAWDF